MHRYYESANAVCACFCAVRGMKRRDTKAAGGEVVPIRPLYGYSIRLCRYSAQLCRYFSFAFVVSLLSICRGLTRPGHTLLRYECAAVMLYQASSGVGPL